MWRVRTACTRVHRRPLMFRSALMGGVSSLAPKEPQPAPAVRRRGRAAVSSAPALGARASSPPRTQAFESDVVRNLREEKVAAEGRRHALLSQLDEADAAITAAESSFARGMGSEAAMEVRRNAAMCSAERNLCRQPSPLRRALGPLCATLRRLWLTQCTRFTQPWLSRPSKRPQPVAPPAQRRRRPSGRAPESHPAPRSRMQRMRQ